MTLVVTLIGFFGSVVTIASLVFSHRFRQFVAKLIPVGGVAWFRRDWETQSLRREMAKATSEVAVLQTWLPTLNADIDYWEAVGDRVIFRVLLADESIVRARLCCRPTAVPLTQQNVDRLTPTIGARGGRMEVRFFRGVPFGPVYIIDNAVYWGIFLANRDSLLGPRFKTSRTSYLGRMVVSSFESMWSATESELKTSEANMSDTTTQPPEPGDEPTELSRDEELSHQYQRHCIHCHTWLNYRSFGPPQAMATESYCPNSNCPKSGERVEGVHVS